MAKITNPADLGIWKATIAAIRGDPTDFYPRVNEGKVSIATLPTPDLLKEFGDASTDWTALPSDSKLDAAIGLARQSLSEVKAQTEYQDQKVGRLLTVATILSALSALLFARFNDAYPVRAMWDFSQPSRLVAFAAYVPFVLFVLAVLSGALVTFHATRTRFKYEQREKAAADMGSPQSRLFYIPILGVRPRVWASSFVVSQRTGDKDTPVINPELGQLYFRDLVGETYLIAAKTADKIRFLEAAQRLFALSLRCLLVWLAMLVLVSLVVEPVPAENGPTLVQLVPPAGASPVTAVRLDQSQPLQVTVAIVQPPAPAPAPTPAADKSGKGGQQ